VFDLLDDIGYPIGMSHLDKAGCFVDRGIARILCEFLSRKSQILDDSRLRLRAQIEVASIVLAAHIDSGNVLSLDP
jgi:hypothetical protein